MGAMLKVKARGKGVNLVGMDVAMSMMTHSMRSTRGVENNPSMFRR